jgi:GNAT superfamily N-acetyltransferase
VIRPATVEDIDDIVRMAGRFLATSSYGRLFQYSPTLLEPLVRLVLDQGVIFLATMVPAALEASRLVDGEERAVGFLAALEATDPYSGLRYADEIAWFVMPEHRNGSFGVRLLAALEAWADAKRLSFVKMVAPTDQLKVGGFYQSIGFEPLETAYVKRLR